MSEQKHYASITPPWFLEFEKEANYMTQKDKCPDCKGTGMGQFNHNKNAPCDTCNGTGEKDKMRETLTNLGMQACSDCGYDCEPPRRKMLCPSDVDQLLALFIADNKSIERMAEELGVNFYDLYPYILMTEKEAKKQGYRDVVQRVIDMPHATTHCDIIQALKEGD